MYESENRTSIKETSNEKSLSVRVISVGRCTHVCSGDDAHCENLMTTELRELFKTSC